MKRQQKAKIRFVRVEGRAPEQEQQILQRLLKKYGVKGNGILLKTSDGKYNILLDNFLWNFPKELWEELKKELKHSGGKT